MEELAKDSNALRQFVLARTEQEETQNYQYWYLRLINARYIKELYEMI